MALTNPVIRVMFRLKTPPKANRLFGIGLRIWEIVGMNRFKLARLGQYKYYTINRCRTSHMETTNFDSLAALASSTYTVWFNTERKGCKINVPFPVEIPGVLLRER